jgi:fatty-acyl-CoA synthase
MLRSFRAPAAASRMLAATTSVFSGRFQSTAAAAAPSSGKFSELAGPRDVQLLDQLAGYYVNIQSRKMYYKDFLRIEHQAVRWAFADIRKNSEALAHGLLQTGCRPGQRVLAIQPCNCETLVLQLACAKIGALLCIMPHQNITADKLRYYLNEFQPSHFVGREWMVVPETKGGELVERNMHFWDMIYNVIPELGLTYPGQKFQWTHSQEFFFLKKTIITDHNMNLLCATPMRRMLVWGPYSYYEQRLRRLSTLLHPDDPLVALEDPKPAAEDKAHVVFSQRNCINAGYIFGQMMKLQAESRFAVMPNHHIDPIGIITAPYAAITSGAVLVQLHDNLFTDEHAISVIEKLCVEEVCGILGTKADFDMVLKHAGNFDADQFEHLKWVALFENSVDEPITEEYLKKLSTALDLDDVYVYSGTFESCFMLQWRSLKKGNLGMVPHAEAKIVGDRGVADAKILANNTRGNLKLKAPHVTPFYFNNGGFMTEAVDERGFAATSREATVAADSRLVVHVTPQTY